MQHRTSAPPLLCAVCSDPVDPDDAHHLHADTCTGRLDGHLGRDVDGQPIDGCTCDLVAHPGCCPAPECASTRRRDAAFWLLRLIAERAIVADSGSARVVLTASMVKYLNGLLVEEEAGR